VLGSEGGGMSDNKTVRQHLNSAQHRVRYALYATGCGLLGDVIPVIDDAIASLQSAKAKIETEMKGGGS